MRVSIRWETTLVHTVSADVDLAAVASWALQALPLGALVDGHVAPPSQEDLVASLRRNPHLCARLVQLHAIAAGETTITTGSRRDQQPSTQK